MIIKKSIDNYNSRKNLTDRKNLVLIFLKIRHISTLRTNFVLALCFTEELLMFGFSIFLKKLKKKISEQIHFFFELNTIIIVFNLILSQLIKNKTECVLCDLNFYKVVTKYC